MSKTKRYFWLKFKDDFFNKKEIKKLRKIAGGDTFTIIYLKMQLLSVKKEGLIVFEGTEECFAEQLSLQIDEDVDNIKITLEFLYANHLLEKISDENFLLTKVPELIGSETDAAERMRQLRQLEGRVEKKPKTNATRQKQFRAKQELKDLGHIPYVEDYMNNKRYNGNYYVVMKRDHMKCLICGSNENLCVHHIDGFNENKPENSNETQMLVLCRSCHSNIHNGKEIPKQILEQIGYCNEYCSPIVRKSYTEIEKEIEKEIELETYKEKNLPYAEIIAYLNKLAGTRYRVTENTKKHISGRFSEGYTKEDFFTVIENKTEEWKGSEWEKYLRPSTLFLPSKFEGYLFQKPFVKKGKKVGNEDFPLDMGGYETI